jgi:hypothetical protein
VQHYFGKIPTETTMREIKAVNMWLQIERARRSVERVFVPRLASWLKRMGAEYARDFRMGQGESTASRAMQVKMSQYLPGYFLSLYSATFKATVPLTPQMVVLRRKAEFELLEPTDLPEYSAWMNRVAGQQVTNVSETTIRGIARIIDWGIANHLSLDKIADRLEVSFGFSPKRADRIARTEVVAASNSTFFYTVNRYYGVNGATKDWLATRDHRTRPTHVRANAEMRDIPFGDNFVVGGATGMFPGDAQFPARERVHCRCTALYHTVLF